MTVEQEIKQRFGDLSFDEPNHEYTVKGKMMTPVSNIVHEFVDEFDTEGIATGVAAREGRTKEEVIQEWEQINKTACDLGDVTHLFGERYAFARFVDSSNQSVPAPTTPQEKALVEYWEDKPSHIMPVGFELQLYNEEFGFAGTCDILLYNTQTQKYIIADYKTNKDIFKNYKEKVMLPPFHYMLDMPYNHYQLQLSLYHILLEEAGYDIESRVIVWVQDDGTYNTYETGDFREMLKNYFNGQLHNRTKYTKSTVIVL